MRIIEIEDEVWVAEQDVFRNLGRLREDEQIRGEDRKKVTEFLGNIDKLSSVESFNITTGGKGKARETQVLRFIKAEELPMLLVLFKPTARAEQIVRDKYWNLMKLINKILEEQEVWKYIIVDKEIYKSENKRLEDLGLADKVPIINTQVCNLLGKLIGVNCRITKATVKDFQSQTTIDLLEAMQVLRNKIVNCLECGFGLKESLDKAFELTKKKYKL